MCIAVGTRCHQDHKARGKNLHTIMRLCKCYMKVFCVFDCCVMCVYTSTGWDGRYSVFFWDWSISICNDGRGKLPSGVAFALCIVQLQVHLCFPSANVTILWEQTARRYLYTPLMLFSNHWNWSSITHAFKHAPEIRTHTLFIVTFRVSWLVKYIL